MYKLGYFERVDISTEQADDDSVINMNVDVVEKPTGTFQIGAGFSSIESFIATAQVQQANLFGTGLGFLLNAQVSGLRQQIDVDLVASPISSTHPSPEKRTFYDQLQVYDGFSQDSIGAQADSRLPAHQPRAPRLVDLHDRAEHDLEQRPRRPSSAPSSAVNFFPKLPLANLFNSGIKSSLRPGDRLRLARQRPSSAEGRLSLGARSMLSRRAGSGRRTSSTS